jgi:hypothetical protein
MSNSGGFFIADGDDRDRYARPRVNRYNMIKRKDMVGIVDFNEVEDENEEEPRLCPHCSVKLGHRIVNQGDPPLPEDDIENSMQCYQCGRICNIHEIEQQKNLQSELKGYKTDNPFDAGKTIIESVPKRTSPAGIKSRKKRNRPHHKDPEIDRDPTTL